MQVIELKDFVLNLKLVSHVEMADDNQHGGSGHESSEDPAQGQASSSKASEVQLAPESAPTSHLTPPTPIPPKLERW